MNRLKNFWIWLDYDCPKPIKWLVNALCYIFLFCIGITIFVLFVAFGVFCFFILPDKLQVIGEFWAMIIEFFAVFPIYLAALYGVIYIFVIRPMKNK